MECKYLFGSKMLRLCNCRDEDWLTFVDKRGAEIKSSCERSIPFYKKRLERFMMGKNKPEETYKAVHLYQLSAPFIEDENYPFNFFNILEHKKVWIEQLKGYINLPKTEEWGTRYETLPKQFYHLLYQYYMITEGVHFISEAAMVDVQKIHDLEMPSSYFYTIRDLINGL